MKMIKANVTFRPLRRVLVLSLILGAVRTLRQAVKYTAYVILGGAARILLKLMK
jgi:hypothetical protein